MNPQNNHRKETKMSTKMHLKSQTWKENDHMITFHKSQIKEKEIQKSHESKGDHKTTKLVKQENQLRKVFTKNCNGDPFRFYKNLGELLGFQHGLVEK